VGGIDGYKYHHSFLCGAGIFTNHGRVVLWVYGYEFGWKCFNLCRTIYRSAFYTTGWWWFDKSDAEYNWGLIMSITKLDDYINAAKQRIGITKVSRTTVQYLPFTTFDLNGNPGAGTIAGATVASAIVQLDSDSGYPAIDFSSGATYLSKVEFANTVVSRLRVVDVIAKSGAYSYASATTAITSYPDITGRCPDYTSAGAAWGYRNEIWLEVSTAFVTGTAWTCRVTYTNADGATSRTTITTGALAATALTLGKIIPLSLQAGDSGVRSIQSVIVTNPSTAMTAGAFNINIVRQLWTSGRVPVANGCDIHDMLKTGLPIVYNTSALALVVNADSTASGVVDVMIELANNG
jgi:hypothetical protein